MIGLKKEALKTKTIEKRFEFSDFRYLKTGNSKTLVGAQGVNCDCSSGAMTTGVGLAVYKNETGGSYPLPSDLTEMQQVQYFWPNGQSLYKDRTIFLQGGNQFYYYETASENFKKILAFNGRTRVIDIFGTDFCARKLFFGEGGVWTYEMSESAKQVLSERVKAACMFKDRVFLLMESQQIVYSAPGALTDFVQSVSDSGRVLWLPKLGETAGMSLLNNELFFFMKNAIMCLKIDGDARDFQLDSIPYTGGNILNGSMAQSNGKICFLTEEGVYLFDGKNAERAYEDLHIKASADQIFRCVPFNNGFILQYIERETGARRSVVLHKDGKQGYFTFDIVGLNAYEGQIFCQKDGYVGVLLENGSLPSGEKYSFISREVDFGDEHAKTLRSITVKGVGIITLTVIADGERKIFEMDLSSGRATVKPYMKANSFIFSFELEKGAVVEKMIADVECLKRR